MDHPYKFGVPVTEGSDAARFDYPDLWASEPTSGSDRLVIAPSRNQIQLLINLSKQMPAHFGVLYVLLVSRTGREP
jgi:hypothetical protein